MPEKLKSRKFWVMFLASVIVMFGDRLGINLDPAQVDGLIWIVVGYIGGQGIVDAADQFTLSAFAKGAAGKLIELPSETPTPSGDEP